MATIRKTTSGKYKAEIYVGRDSDGKPIREYITRDKKRDALEDSKKRELQIKEQAANASRLAPTTIKSYTMFIEHHFKTSALAKIKVGKITTLHIQQYFATKTTDEKMNPNTLIKHHFFLSGVLKDALHFHSPMINVKPPQKTKFVPVILHENEFVLAWDILRGTNIELPFLLGAYCGLRAGEIAALKWNDIVDDQNMSIRIDESMTLNAEDASYSFKSPKSKAGYRTLIAPVAVAELIRKLPRGLSTDRLVNLRADTIGKTFRKYVDNYNDTAEESKKIPPVRFHDLRHYHATALWKMGFDPRFAADRLGHDINVMQSIYTHMDNEYKQSSEASILNAFSDTYADKKSGQKSGQNCKTLKST